MVAEDVAAFGRAVAARLRSFLGSDLVGAYFVGSIALGGYVPGESDIDVVAVSAGPFPGEHTDTVTAALLDAAVSCPARGLEFTLYRRQVAATPPESADFEINVNGGPRMPRTVHLDALDEPWFWYVLDRAIAHRHGVTICGPPAAEVFADAPRRTLLDAMAESMRWHRAHEKATLYSVLNASRAWRFAADDTLGSKLAGAAWARDRWRRPTVIETAVDLRHGRPGKLNAAEVDEFLGYVEEVLGNSMPSAEQPASDAPG